MTITAKCLINAKYASNSENTEYVATGVRAIIDKFTACNIDGGGSHVIHVSIVKSGDAAGDGNRIVKQVTIASYATFDSTEMKNQILNPGDFISIKADAASAVVIRCSGREVT